MDSSNTFKSRSFNATTQTVSSHSAWSTASSSGLKSSQDKETLIMNLRNEVRILEDSKNAYASLAKSLDQAYNHIHKVYTKETEDSEALIEQNQKLEYELFNLQSELYGLMTYLDQNTEATPESDNCFADINYNNNNNSTEQNNPELILPTNRDAVGAISRPGKRRMSLSLMSLASSISITDPSKQLLTQGCQPEESAETIEFSAATLTDANHNNNVLESKITQQSQDDQLKTSPGQLLFENFFLIGPSLEQLGFLPRQQATVGITATNILLQSHNGQQQAAQLQQQHSSGINSNSQNNGAGGAGGNPTGFISSSAPNINLNSSSNNNEVNQNDSGEEVQFSQSILYELIPKKLDASQREVIIMHAFPFKVKCKKYRVRRYDAFMSEVYKSLFTENKVKDLKQFVFTIKGAEQNYQKPPTESDIIPPIVHASNPNHQQYCVYFEWEDYFFNSRDKSLLFKCPLAFCFVTYYPFFSFFREVLCHVLSKLQKERIPLFSLHTKINSDSFIQLDASWIIEELKKQMSIYSRKLLELQKQKPEIQQIIQFSLEDEEEEEEDEDEDEDEDNEEELDDIDQEEDSEDDLKQDWNDTKKASKLNPRVSLQLNNKPIKNVMISSNKTSNQHANNSSELHMNPNNTKDNNNAASKNKITTKNNNNNSGNTSKCIQERSLVSFMIPSYRQLPLLEISQHSGSHMILSSMTFEDFWFVLNLVMLEQQIVFTSSNLLLAASALQTFTSIFKPFNCCTLIFHIFEGRYTLLETPPPFIGAINQSFKYLLANRLVGEDQARVNFLDLDSKKIFLSRETIDLFNSGKAYMDYGKYHYELRKTFGVLTQRQSNFEFSDHQSKQQFNQLVYKQSISAPLASVNPDAIKNNLQDPNSLEAQKVLQSQRARYVQNTSELKGRALEELQGLIQSTFHHYVLQCLPKEPTIDINSKNFSTIEFFNKMLKKTEEKAFTSLFLRTLNFQYFFRIYYEQLWNQQEKEKKENEEGENGPGKPQESMIKHQSQPKTPTQ